MAIGLGKALLAHVRRAEEWPIHRRGVVIGVVAAALAGSSAPGAAAHPDLFHTPGQSVAGRQPGQPDFQRIGDTTYRYRPDIGQYEIKTKGRPPAFAHYDDVVASETTEAGPNTPLPIYEDQPHCRTSGHRVVVVHTHRSNEAAADSTMKAALRSIVRRMNWKIVQQSSLSSGGAREVEMAVDCNAEGQINVYDVVVPGWGYAEVSSAVKEELGNYYGASAVKYLTFDQKYQGGGIAGIYSDTAKNQGNENAKATTVSIPYREVWETHVPVHELFHNFGASQGTATPPAPYSTYYHHCVDGLDVLCYEDGDYTEWGWYSETRCPAGEGYGEPTKTPIDCKYDTYFNTAPEEETWLAEYWDSGGPENPFLVAPPTATSEAATGIVKYKATLHGTVNPEGTDTTYYFEYGPDTNYGTKVPLSGETASAYSATPISVNSTISGLEDKTTYHFRLVASNDVSTTYGTDKAFTTWYSPIVTTEALSNIHVSGEDGKATLHGKVNPNGFATHYHFEWGETETKLDHVVPAEDVNVGSGESAVSVEQPIEGLHGKSYYYYRVVAENESGESLGETKGVYTPNWAPSTKLDVSDIGLEDATVKARINPKGFETTYYFEWGPDKEYGNRVPIPDGNVGSGQEDIEVSEAVEGLEENTTYYYRVIAESSEGGGGYAKSFRTHSNSDFFADEYPVEFHSVGELLQLDAWLFSMVCEPPVFAGEVEDASPALSAEGFEGQICSSGAFETNDCKFFFYPGEVSEGEAEGTLQIGPAWCGPITIDFTYVVWKCPIEISPQSVYPVTLRNEGEANEAKVVVEMDESAAFNYVLGGACKGAFGEWEDLTLEGSWEVSATVPESEEQVGLWIGDL